MSSTRKNRPGNAAPQRSLPACPTILDVIGDLLADGCQIEELLLNKDIVSLFGKLPIHSRLLPKIARLEAHLQPVVNFFVDFLEIFSKW